MEKLQNLLQNSRNGNTVLFCGAGFTADCLSFDDDSTLGVTFHLLNIINGELKSKGKQGNFKDIKNAAKKFRTEIGNHRLMRLLKERFKINKASASISDILSYPWSSIYTTNYDNGIELSLQNIGKRYDSLNNLEGNFVRSNSTPVIHLHGLAEAWTDNNFEQSCILDSSSYHRLSGVKEWLKNLRFDIERADLVVFIGFSAADFHLSQVFFYASGLREKAFFINRPSSDPDPDERANQEDFGTPLYIGREEFSQIVTQTLQKEAPVEPRLASFRRYFPPHPSNSVPPVQDIEDLFIWGKVVHSHLKRDNDNKKSDYHVMRNEVDKIEQQIENGEKVVIVNGDICDGKSLAILGAMNIISSSRPVFELHHTYADLLEETASIIAFYENPVLVIENFSSIREDRLLGLARQIAGSDGSLILSSRSISTEAESSKIKGLKSIPATTEMTIGKLQPSEVDSFIALIDQIAGWRNYRALSPSDRRKFVEFDCKGIIPSVLLRLLESDYVRKKYREEYNKISIINERDRQMIIAALLISSIGLDAPLALLSDIFEHDFLIVLKSISAQSSGLRLVRADGNTARTIPSIGARNLLKSIIEPRDIVNTAIYMLEKMAEETRRTDFQQHVFSQLMRYSILNSTVSDEQEINRFFDHISKISHFRGMPLFWLQWHMAMSAQEKWIKAEEYLEMGYTSAAAYEKRRGEKFNRKQLDDRKAKFLSARALSLTRSSVEIFRDMKDALDIVARLMHDSEITHHPYETLRDICKVLERKGSSLVEFQSRMLSSQVKLISEQAKNKVIFVPEGYQRSHAIESMRQIEVMILH